MKVPVAEVDPPREKEEGWLASAMAGQMRREEIISGNPVLVKVRTPGPPTMAEEPRVQLMTLSLSLTVVLVTV